MASLADLQKRFAAALLAPEGAALGFAIARAAASFDRVEIERLDIERVDIERDNVERLDVERMDIYRRAIFANYRKALAATYPTVQRILGDAIFARAVAAYVRTQPSKSGDLNDYGDTFGAFLASHPPAAHLAHLPDIARLEWAIDEANRASDVDVAPDAVLAALAALPPDRLPAVKLMLSPSCRLIASAFPIFKIWQSNQVGAEGHARADAASENGLDDQGDGRVDSKRGDALLVRRDAGGVSVERLGAGEHLWLVALAEGATLHASIDVALAQDPSFDLGRVLHAHIGAATIVAITEGAA